MLRCPGLSAKLMVFSALALSISGAASAQMKSSTSDDLPAPGTLAWHAKRASNEGKLTITLGPESLLYAEVEPLDVALRHNSVVVATLLQSETTHDDRAIFTWRKYKLDETLAKQARAFHQETEKQFRVLVASAPKSMLPLGPGEFLMYEPGGAAVVDGVKINAPGEGNQFLAVGSRYLMFVLFGASGKLAGGSYGPTSLFAIDSSDTLHGRMGDSGLDRNPLLQEIRQRTNGNLSVLRSLSAETAGRH